VEAAGARSGDESPRSPGFATAGSRGSEVDPLVAEPTRAAPDAPDEADALEPEERPGATAATSTAKPAVSPAVPPTTQRRVRLTRSSAASRSDSAGDRPWDPMWGFCALLICSPGVKTISHQ
jgi:hypothetical protein